MQWFVTCLRIALAAVLLLAAIGKVRSRENLIAFLSTLRVPGTLVRPASNIIVLLEVVAAPAILFSPRHYAGAVALLLFASFLVASQIGRRNSAACGCFGSIPSSLSRVPLIGRFVDQHTTGQSHAEVLRVVGLATGLLILLIPVKPIYINALSLTGCAVAAVLAFRLARGTGRSTMERDPASSLGRHSAVPTAAPPRPSSRRSFLVGSVTVVVSAILAFLVRFAGTAWAVCSYQCTTVPYLCSNCACCTARHDYNKLECNDHYGKCRDAGCSHEACRTCVGACHVENDQLLKACQDAYCGPCPGPECH